jgi:hypothetical protein
MGLDRLAAIGTKQKTNSATSDAVRIVGSFRAGRGRSREPATSIKALNMVSIIEQEFGSFGVSAADRTMADGGCCMCYESDRK